MRFASTNTGFQQKLDEARQLLLGRHFAQALSRYAKLTREQVINDLSLSAGGHALINSVAPRVPCR